MFIKVTTLILMTAFYICYFAKMIADILAGNKGDKSKFALSIATVPE